MHEHEDEARELSLRPCPCPGSSDGHPASVTAACHPSGTVPGRFCTSFSGWPLAPSPLCSSAGRRFRCRAALGAPLELCSSAGRRFRCRAALCAQLGSSAGGRSRRRVAAGTLLRLPARGRGQFLHPSAATRRRCYPPPSGRATQDQGRDQRRPRWRRSLRILPWSDRRTLCSAPE